MAHLEERDHNQMAEQAAGKRKRVSDLTSGGDGEDDTSAPVPKVLRRGSQTGAHRHSATATSSVPLSGSRGSSQPLHGTSNQQCSVVERDACLTDDDDDVNLIVGSSQDHAERSDQLHLYGDMPTKIVGVQYYGGYSNPGEYILMRREPGNPYDSNAIRIDNVAGTQVGHIPRKVAEKLARYMDERSLLMEGRLAGAIGQFDCALTVSLYGPDPHSATGRDLQTRMRVDRLPLTALHEAERARQKCAKEKAQAEKQRLAEARRAAAGGKGIRIPFGGSSQFANQNTPAGDGQIDLSDILEASQRINPRDFSKNADKLGASEQELNGMPMASQPESVNTELLPFQKQALQWLLDQESPTLPSCSSGKSVQLWKAVSGTQYTNLASNYSTQTPTLASGGILADDMGLGKTLEMISLIAADAEKFGRGPTLIVAPVTVLSNWTGQVALHVKEHRMDVYVYHENGRVPMRGDEFAKYDIVLTTYGTLASDYMPKGKGPQNPDLKLQASGLYSTEWRRIILDEGHIIRNPQTKGALAAAALTARSKWALTGTPIVNSLRDLYSLLRFVGVGGGLGQLEVFNSALIRPLKAGDESAQYLLRAIMRAFTLRRTKDMKFVDLRLPKLDEYVYRIDFTPKEQEKYDALDAEAQGLLRKAEKVGTSGSKGGSVAYNHLLEILLRMRQCCNHWQLCGERVTKLLAQLEMSKTVELTEENKQGLQDMLQVRIDCSEDCAICLEVLHKPVITTCGHAFGRECIEVVIEGQHKCPMCRAELKDNTCLVEPRNEFGDDSIAEDEELDLTQSSSKLEALLKILEATKESGNKTVIFSQWTSFLDLVEARLDRAGYKMCRVDGSMTASKREASLRALIEDDDTTIILASLGVCAVGLNLTAASNVILCDTWWAPAIEDQAVDRVHRLGQKKETKVFRLVMDKSIEERTLSVSADKRKLMAMAFSEQHDNKAHAKSGRLADIRRLLG